MAVRLASMLDPDYQKSHGSYDSSGCWELAVPSFYAEMTAARPQLNVRRDWRPRLLADNDDNAAYDLDYAEKRIAGFVEQYHRPPLDVELAEACGWSAQRVTDMRKAMPRVSAKPFILPLYQDMSRQLASGFPARDPDTGAMPSDLAGQVSNIFKQIALCVTAAGGSPGDILKINFWMKDPATGRAALNGEWVKMFPDPESRPARHTLALGATSPHHVTCDFTAVIG